MSDVINRTTKQFLKSVSSPDYSETDWIINPDLSAVASVPSKYWKINGDSVIEMSQEEKDIVNANATALYIETLIKEAMVFGNKLMLEFSRENVQMGITQLNKTGEVVDYLSKLLSYISTGSLHQSVLEIDALIAAGIPSDLSPFITEARLLVYKQNILDWLNS